MPFLSGTSWKGHFQPILLVQIKSKLIDYHQRKPIAVKVVQPYTISWILIKNEHISKQISCKVIPYTYTYL
jgi:hypothetical protein